MSSGGMHRAVDRAAALCELDAYERKLRTLLSMVEAPVTDMDGLAQAREAVSMHPFDAEKIVAQFRDADASEIAVVRNRLVRLADLDAVARAVCARELEKTVAKMDRLRRFRTQLDTMQTVEHAGESLDTTS
jgi:hypothetical protein